MAQIWVIKADGTSIVVNPSGGVTISDTGAFTFGDISLNSITAADIDIINGSGNARLLVSTGGAFTSGIDFSVGIALASIVADQFSNLTITGGLTFATLTSNGLLTTSGGTGAVSVTTPGAGVLTFLQTPSSANLAAAVTGETGTGALVFGTSPTFTTSILVPDGASVSAPGIAFASETGLGIRRSAAATLQVTSLGVAVFSAWSDSVNQFFGFAASPISRDNGTGKVFIAMQAFSGSDFGVELGDAAASVYLKAASDTPSDSVLKIQNLSNVTKVAVDSGFNLFLGVGLKDADGDLGTAGQRLASTGTATNWVSETESIGFTAFDSTAVPTGKVKGFFACRFGGTITGWSIVVDAGTATVKVWKIAAGTAKPTISNVINTSGVAISSGTAIESTTTSDFTSTTVTAGDIFAYDITAASGVTEITFQLLIAKT